MTILFSLAAALVAGLVFNRAAKKFGLPNVTGYIFAGLIIGPYGLKIIHEDILGSLEMITTVTLGFIAFSIGGNFKLSHIKKIGGSVLTITFFQAIMAALLVDIALIVAGFDTPLALILGAIATATAPAATLMVIRQYKARGPLTNILIPVVAIDDAIGLIVFSVSFSIARMLSAGVDISIMKMFIDSFIEIFASVAFGGLIGLLLTHSIRFFKSNSNRLILGITAVILGTAIAELEVLGHSLSLLLLCTSIGAIMANFSNECECIMSVTDNWTPVLYLLFFVITGAGLDLRVLPKIGLIGIIYLVARSFGKYFGAFWGSAIMKQDKNIRNYLGLTLLPQAGVAIGMIHVVVSALPEYGDIVRAVVLSSTLIFALAGPLLTKFCLLKAGEIKGVPHRKKKAAVLK